MCSFSFRLCPLPPRFLPVIKQSLNHLPFEVRRALPLSCLPAPWRATPIYMTGRFIPETLRPLILTPLPPSGSRKQRPIRFQSPPPLPFFCLRTDLLPTSFDVPPALCSFFRRKFLLNFFFLLFPTPGPLFLNSSSICPQPLSRPTPKHFQI